MAAVEVLMSSDQNDSFCQGGDSILRSSSHGAGRDEGGVDAGWLGSEGPRKEY